MIDNNCNKRYENHYRDNQDNCNRIDNNCCCCQGPQGPQGKQRP